MITRPQNISYFWRVRKASMPNKINLVRTLQEMLQTQLVGFTPILSTND